MKKRTAVTVISFLTAGVLIASGFALSCSQRAQRFQGGLRSSFFSSLEEMGDSLERLSVSVNKARNALTDGFLVSALCDVQSSACSAAAALDAFPRENEQTVTLAGRLYTVGDYARTLITGISSGVDLSEEKQILGSLCAAADSANELYAKLREEIDGGGIDLSELDAFEGGKYGEDAVPLSDALGGWADGLSAFPEMSYDGRYAEGVGEAGFVWLKTLPEADAKETAGKATALLGNGAEKLTSREGSQRFVNGEAYAEYTSSGMLMSYSAASGENSGDPDSDASVDAALAFAGENGYKDIVPRLVKTEGKTVSVLLAREENGVLFLDETVAVTASGEKIIAFNALKYLENRSGNSPVFTKSEAEAAALTEPFCEILYVRRAVMLSAGKREIPCYEFHVRPKETSYGNGENEQLLCINAETLAEESMTVLSEETGMLASD